MPKKGLQPAALPTPPTPALRRPESPDRAPLVPATGTYLMLASVLVWVPVRVRPF